MTTPRKKPSANRAPQFVAELQELIPRLQNLAAAQIVWATVLTDRQRKKLGGSLDRAYEDGATIGIWMKAHRVGQPQAIIEAAHAIGLLTEPHYLRLVKQLGGRQPKNSHEGGPGKKAGEPQKKPLPSWDKEARELRYGSTVIRRVPRPRKARNVVTVLDTFQLEGWPTRIDDPLPGGPNGQRLHATIRSLKKGLKKIIFSADGTGKGFMWRTRA